MDSRLHSLRAAWARAIAAGPLDVAAAIGLARSVGFLDTEAAQAAARVAMGAVLAGEVEVGDADELLGDVDAPPRFDRWAGDSADHAGRLARAMIAAADTHIEPHDVATFRLVQPAPAARNPQGDQAGVATFPR